MPLSAPIQTPTQNTGAHAQGALYAAQAMDGLKKAVAMLNPSSPLGQAVLRALKDIGKEVGNVPADVQQNNLQAQLLAARRNAMQRLAMQQMQQQPAQNPMAAIMGGQGGAQQQPAAMAA